MGVPSQARDAALEIGKILDGQLVGIYLYGSAVEGGLNARGIDWLPRMAPTA